MKKKGIVVVGVIFLLVVVSLSGCENSVNAEKNKFIGSWRGSFHVNQLNYTNYSWVVIFYANGTFDQAYNKGGFWSIDNGQVTLNHPTRLLIVSYSFSQNDTVLTMENPSCKYVLTKQ